MKIIKIVVLTILVILVSGFSGSAEGTIAPENEKLEQIFKQYEEWVLDRSPEWASFLGDDSRSGEMDDYSLQGIEQDHRRLKTELAKLLTVNYKPLSKKNKFLFRLFKIHLQKQIDGHIFKGYLRPINQRPDSIHLVLMNLATYLVFSTEKNYHDYLARLGQVPRIMDEVMERMKLGIDEGISYPKQAMHAVAGQLASVLEKPEKTPFYKPFHSLPEKMDSAVKNKLKKEALSIIAALVIPAYEKFHKFWVKEYYPGCSGSLAQSDQPNGKAWYGHLLKTYTTTDLTADQIHKKGLSEVARIKKEMEKIKTETEFEGSLSEFIKFLKTDPRFYYDNAQDLLNAYRAECKRIDPELVKILGKLPRLPYGVRSITTQESLGQAGYCDIGSLKQGRPSYLAMTTSNLKAIKSYQMTALILHEMVPGHHLQISLAMENEDKPFFTMMDNYHAYTEGWALYSESLGHEMGLYNDPYSRFGQLDLNMLRAARMVVDTGIHSKGWSRRQALQYFKENSSLDDDFIQTEVDRYIVYPGQAVSYKVGEIEFLRLRKKAEKELGKNFDIREYHDRLLENGSIPLNLLAEIVEDYIREKNNPPVDSGQTAGR